MNQTVKNENENHHPFFSTLFMLIWASHLIYNLFGGILGSDKTVLN